MQIKLSETIQIAIIVINVFIVATFILVVFIKLAIAPTIGHSFAE